MMRKKITSKEKKAAGKADKPFGDIPIRDALRPELSWTHYRCLMRVLFTEKINIFMKQSEETLDAVLRVELMRDAVRTALKGLEYLPDDEELAYKAGSADLRLKYLAG